MEPIYLEDREGSINSREMLCVDCSHRVRQAGASSSISSFYFFIYFFFPYYIYLSACLLVCFPQHFSPEKFLSSLVSVPSIYHPIFCPKDWRKIVPISFL